MLKWKKWRFFTMLSTHFGHVSINPDFLILLFIPCVGHVERVLPARWTCCHQLIFYSKLNGRGKSIELMKFLSNWISITNKPIAWSNFGHLRIENTFQLGFLLWLRIEIGWFQITPALFIQRGWIHMKAFVRFVVSSKVGLFFPFWTQSGICATTQNEQNRYPLVI